MSGVEKVVVVVFDGLRPDMVEGRMPHLQNFLEGGLSFSDARSVFPSVTRVATTSAASGAWPGRHGIINNTFHMADILPGRAINTSVHADLALLEQNGEALVTCTTLGQQLAAHGKSFHAVHGGSVGAAFLINHKVSQNGHWTFSVHGNEATQTPAIVDEGVRRCGPLPGADVPRFDAIKYMGEVMRTLALGEDQADLSLLWLPEPDTSYHYRQIGSEETRAVMRAADDMFAMLVDHIRSGPFGDKTAIIVMSDHGQITTTKEVDLGAAMQADGFKVSHLPDEETQIALTRGNMGELRMLTPDAGLPRAAVEWLMQHEDIGMVFARDDLAGALPGTLPMSLVYQTHDRTPELYYVMRSTNELDMNGLPGQTAYSGGPPVGGGMHGGLNQYEMNIVLAMDVPGGRHGEVDPTPACLIDVAPTILSLLGITHEADGRVLPVYQAQNDVSTEEVTEARKGDFAQRLMRQRLGNRTYLSYGGRIN